MWVQASITVGLETVSLEVRRLEPDGRARAAASIAWSTCMALESGEHAGPGAWPREWQSLVGDDCCRLQGCEGREFSEDRWHEAVRRAIAEFEIGRAHV